VAIDYAYADAITVHMLKKPDFYDVIVAENMFGDIMSDLGAGTVGGLGIAASAELGEHHGLFQGAHGSAPDIAGQDLASPVATILSGALMLRWLADRHGDGAGGGCDAGRAGGGGGACRRCDRAAGSGGRGQLYGDDGGDLPGAGLKSMRRLATGQLERIQEPSRTSPIRQIQILAFLTSSIRFR
jgi:hypothetical protein